MTFVHVVGCARDDYESWDLLCRRREAIPQFKEREIIQNLILT